MTSGTKTLVMAGAREAHGVIDGLLARTNLVIASLPEVERSFAPLPVPVRTGRFEKAQDLSQWIADQSVSRVIDASHAFDEDICRMVRSVCREQALPYLRLLRPPWFADANDLWHEVACLRDAARAVPRGARVFSNTGWLSLPDYVDFAGDRLFLRQTGTEVRTAGFDFVTFIPGTPPFSAAQEEEMFRALGITHLICRNTGGEASKSKLLAAREMGLPVFMVARPKAHDPFSRAHTVEEALEWQTAT